MSRPFPFFLSFFFWDTQSVENEVWILWNMWVILTNKSNQYSLFPYLWDDKILISTLTNTVDQRHSKGLDSIKTLFFKDDKVHQSTCLYGIKTSLDFIDDDDNCQCLSFFFPADG